MSEELPDKPLNGGNDDASKSESSEKCRSNSSFSGSLNLNIRPLGINTKLTFGNRSSTSRDARSSTKGTTCRCLSDGTDAGPCGSRHCCHRSGASNHSDRGFQSRSSSSAGYKSRRNDFSKKNANHVSERQHSVDYGATPYGSTYSKNSGVHTGARPKRKVSTTSNFGAYYDNMPVYQGASQLASTESYSRGPLDGSRNSENTHQRFDDAQSQNELDFMLGNGHTNVSSCSGEHDDLIYPTGDVTKLSDGTYDLNGLKLSLEELEFVLDQSFPTGDLEASTCSGDGFGYFSSTNNHCMGSDMSGREGGAWSSHVQHTENSANRQMKFRRHPATSAEKLLASSSLELVELPWADDEELSKCPICLGGLQSDSPAQTSSHAARGLVGAVMLANCGHAFHCCCLLPLLTTASEMFSCPLCRTAHGGVTGTQPHGGTMRTSLLPYSLPGFEAANTIVIVYELPEGVQGPGHPNPGQPYLLKGFPRKAYLPDTPKGRQVASLLKKAFERRLVFTVGHSESLDLDDCVIWGSIAHKTLVRDKKFGYPDPHYLDNVMLELAALGVHEDP